MVVPTQIRAGLVTALLAGFQSAKGTAVTDFTAATAKRLWTVQAPLDYGPIKSEPSGFMMKDRMPVEGRHDEPAPAKGRVTILATAQSVQWALRSIWGSYAAGAFTRTLQVNEWLTLGWVENVLAGATENFLRLRDAFFHRLTFFLAKSGDNPGGQLRMAAEYAAEVDEDPVALNALGGVTLPTAPMLPADKDIFPGRLVRLFRDPAGANQEIQLHDLTLVIDAGLDEYWSTMQGVTTVGKRGFPGPKVTLAVEGHVANETWTLLTNARSKTRQTFRVQATVGATVLRFDLYEVEFTVQPLGHEGRDYVKFRGIGDALLSAAGNFVNITLS